MSFAGSTAIVTGGASGIGLAISERLAADGAKVSVFDLDLEQGERAVRTIVDEGGKAIACQVDVSDRAQVDAAVERTRSSLGRVLVLVNGAGKDGFDRFIDIGTELWERIIAVNLTGTFHCTQAVLPDMIENGGGSIINNSSGAALGPGRGPYPADMPVRGGTMYGASKAALELLTRTLATELRDDGVSAVIVDPGDMRTRMHQEAFPREDISDRPVPEVTIPFWRWLFDQHPEEVSGRRFAAQQEQAQWLQQA